MHSLKALRCAAGILCTSSLLSQDVQPPAEPPSAEVQEAAAEKTVRKGWVIDLTQNDTSLSFPPPYLQPMKRSQYPGGKGTYIEVKKPRKKGEEASEAQ